MGVEVRLRMGPAEWGLLVLLSVLWGGSFLFNAIALRELPPLGVVTGRSWLGALALGALLALARHRLPVSPSVWGGFLVMGALNNVVPFTLIVWGQQHVPSGLAAILNATTPLFTVVLAHALTTDERLRPHRAAGVLLGLAGVVVLVGPGALGGLGDDVLGQLAMLGASCAYGLGGIWGRRFHGLPPLVAAAGMAIATAALLVPVALVAAPWRPALGAATWGALGGLGLGSTAAAYWIYFRILRTAGATNLMLVTLLVPVTALLLGAGVLGERPGAEALAAMALIGAGLVALDGRALRRR